MREFSWKYFTLTGDIEAYLLYCAHAPSRFGQVDEEPEEGQLSAWSESDLISFGPSV